MSKKTCLRKATTSFQHSVKGTSLVRRWTPSCAKMRGRDLKNTTSRRGQKGRTCTKHPLGPIFTSSQVHTWRHHFETQDALFVSLKASSLCAGRRLSDPYHLHAWIPPWFWTRVFVQEECSATSNNETQDTSHDEHHPASASTFVSTTTTWCWTGAWAWPLICMISKRLTSRRHRLNGS